MEKTPPDGRPARARRIGWQAEPGRRSAACAISPSVTPADVTAVRAMASMVRCRSASPVRSTSDAVSHVAHRPSRSRRRAARAPAAGRADFPLAAAHFSRSIRSVSSTGIATPDGTIRYTPGALAVSGAGAEVGAERAANREGRTASAQSYVILFPYVGCPARPAHTYRRRPSARSRVGRVGRHRRCRTRELRLSAVALLRLVGAWPWPLRSASSPSSPNCLPRTLPISARGCPAYVWIGARCAGVGALALVGRDPPLLLRAPPAAARAPRRAGTVPPAHAAHVAGGASGSASATGSRTRR